MSETTEPMNNIAESNYIKLDGRVFAITPIANQQVNIETELKSFYNDKYQRHIAVFNGGLVSGLSEDWTKQIARLQEHNTRTTVAIPPEKMNKFVICIDGREVEEVRPVLYSPHVFKMVRSTLVDALGISGSRDESNRRVYEEGKFKTSAGVEYDLNDWVDDTVLLVNVKQKHFFPALYSFNARNNRLHCLNVNTFHSQSHGICTGGQRASAFWNSANFAEVMNQVNCFSLGSQAVHMNVADSKRYHIRDFVKRSTITEIAEEVSGKWRT